MMRAREAVVCPACGTYNRPTWEFCARCNESLEGAQRARPQDLAALQDDIPIEAPSAVSTLVLLASVAGLAVLPLWAYRHVSTTTGPSGPDPRMFTVATQPPSLPEVAAPAGPGAADFDAGRRRLNTGDVAGALPLLESAVAADPENAEYRRTLAAALFRAGDREGSLAQRAEAARLDPRFELEYARALDVAGRSDDAVEVFRRVVAQNPEASVVQEDLGRLLYRTGEYAEAAPHLQVAVEARPDDPVLRQEFAYALDRAGDTAAAVDEYHKVLETAPRAAITRGLLAENLYQQGRKDEAMKVIEEGLALSPEAPLLQRQLGSLLERAGQREQAAAAYREYARLAPNSPDAKTMVDRAARLDALGRP
jgi:tetratricopeptide (TPR) repeat protein